MNAEVIRILIGSGFFMLLLMLRLDANRFGAAEYDESGRRHSGPWMQIAWYLIGMALLAALYVVHPAPHDVLLLLGGERSLALEFGLVLAAVGIIQAAAFARFRYGYLRLPQAGAYPGAAFNAIGTALVDEATFRGALLGTLVAVGLSNGVAILVATLAYVVTTRVAAPGGHPYMVLIACVMGLAFGWATIATGGIGAAIIGHAVTSFAVFVCTGHAGQVPLDGREPEEVELRKRPPDGWQDARPALVAGRGVEPRGFAEQIEPSGFAERADRRAAAARHAGGILAWARSTGRALTHSAQRGAR